MEIITYNKESYPKFQAEGNASQFAIPFAKKLCKGNGIDIGCNRKEWAFPGAQPIDLMFHDPWDAYNLPDVKYDYIFSSHCLEHLENWVEALDYWKSHLKIGGVLFLYLPHFDQQYWRPWHNKKHIHVFVPEIVVNYFKDRNFNNVFHSERDLNHSFIVVGEKS